METAETLETLLQMLYEPPYGIDILTRQLIRDRFPLTKFKAPAQRAIEQSQRILQASGNYDQMGLCEFHIGLIFLEYNSFRSAAAQFVQARNKWGFVNFDAGNCLARFAQGRAVQMVYQYERAAILYNRAERDVQRLAISPPSDKHAAFAEALLKQIIDSQKALGAILWETDAPHNQPAPAASSTAGSDPHQAKTSASAEAPPIPPAPPPIDHETDSGSADKPPPRPASAPLPENHLSSDPITPVDGHKKINDSYRWYQVVRRVQDGFLPDIQANAWVLINTKATNPTQTHAPLAISQLFEDASILLEPRAPHEGTNGRICLGSLSLTGPFERDPSGTIKLSVSPNHIEEFDTTAEDILGTVIGIWLKADFIMSEGSPF